MAFEAVSAVEALNHPVLYCTVLLDAVAVFLWEGDYEEAERCAQRAITNATKYHLAVYRALALCWTGELLVATGDAASGVVMLQSSLEALNANHYNTVQLAAVRALAEGLAVCGQPDQALVNITKAIARAELTGTTLWLPDLLRARGEILLVQATPDLLEAEQSLLRAIDVAKKQSSLSWELKAALPLARIWSQTGRSDEAKSILAMMPSKFAEGADTKDLVAAREFLNELCLAT
jgi:predicted ATPase